jgi:hypothetical protein
MTNALSGTLGDRPLAEVVAVPATETVGEALARAHGRWVVPTDATGAPLAAAAPHAFDHQRADRPLATVIRDLPPAVVADAETPLRAFLGSRLIEEMEPESAVILVAGGNVRGVWAGPDLNRVVAVSGGMRATFGDHELPGEITIPVLTKPCQFQDSGVLCTAVRQFPEPPTTMPQCDNPAGLSPHRFRW